MNDVELNIKSDIFKEMLSELNGKLQYCLKELHEEKFEDGKITLGLEVALIEKEESTSKSNNHGEIEPSIYEYKEPKITYSVNLQLKKKYGSNGTVEFKDSVELVEKGGIFIAKPIKGSQIKMGDFFSNAE